MLSKDWTQVSRTTGEHSTHLANEQVKMYKINKYIILNQRIHTYARSHARGFGLVGFLGFFFFGISTSAGYSMPNPSL